MDMAMDLLLNSEQSKVIDLGMLDPTCIKKYREGKLNFERGLGPDGTVEDEDHLNFGMLTSERRKVLQNIPR